MNKKVVLISIVVLAIIGIIGFVLVSNLGGNDEVVVTNIKLAESTWVTPLNKYTINDTEDTFEITNEVNIPKSKKGETVSWSQVISYTALIDGVEYQGSFTFGTSGDTGRSKDEDNNPKYDIDITNFKDNSVLVEIKNR